MFYPETHEIEQFDDYHGVVIRDPYRWLENTDSEETRVWIEEQNKLSSTYLNNVPERKLLKQRITKLFEYKKHTLPIKRGNRYFYMTNSGTQNYNVLCYSTSLEQQPIVLIDPNQSSKKLLRWSPSKNGDYLAYSLSVSGSDWQEWRIKNVLTGKDFNECIKWSKFSTVSWSHDHKGFFYCCYDEPESSNQTKDLNYSQKLFYHHLGSSQAEDELILERLDKKEWHYDTNITENGRYLIISVWQNVESKNLVFYKDLHYPESSIVEVITDFNAYFTFISSSDSTLFFLTDVDSPCGRLIAIDIHSPARKDWHEIISSKKETLQSVKLLNNHFFATYIQNAYSAVKVFGLDGTFIQEMILPTLGTVGRLSGDKNNTEVFYSFSSFYCPNTIYKYELQTNQSDAVWQTSIDFDFHQYKTQQVFYKSKDGTLVPMFITYKNNLKLDGKNPTYLYGYGGFNASLTPRFSEANLVWMEMGGILAVANIRGGGEYGREWHEAAIKLNKQRSFEDFIAAAEWLITNDYTSQSKLAIGGRSNGGLLVGACLTQRPDLYGAAIPEVGGMDMLRFNKFTIGWAWVSDYGSPDDPDEFKALYAYSPLHNIRNGTSYPATLISTSRDDDRVVPSHSYKFAATLQKAQACSKLILLKVHSGSGHGAGRSLSQTIDEITDKWIFLIQTLSMEVKVYK